MRRMLFGVIAILIGLISTLLFLEIVLRFLPVNEGMHTQPVNAANPIIRFEPDRTFTWSRFPDFSMQNTVHVNNAGYVNDQDYTPQNGLPILAIIGDSYVEAAMVPFPETISGRLAETLKERFRVYSFGVSGAPLSQYLAFAKHVRNTYKPGKMIIVVVGNDYDESLLRYKSSGGFHYFGERDGSLELVRRNLDIPLTTRLVRNSRLAMYLASNVRLQNILRAHEPSQEFIGQTEARADAERLELSRRAVDTFLMLLPEHSGLAPVDITLVVDALRPHLYDTKSHPVARDSFAGRMNRYLLDHAARLGFRTIDMTEPFLQEYRIHRQRFEFDQDGHWNALGHDVVARAILNQLSVN